MEELKAKHVADLRAICDKIEEGLKAGSCRFTEDELIKISDVLFEARKAAGEE